MSLVLGPIHELMYSRILAQEGLIQALLADQPDCLAGLNAAIRPSLDSPLAEQIGDQPIHAWLQQRVDQVEARQAFAWAMAHEGERRAEQWGFEQAQATATRPDWALLNRLLLDGMPCEWAIKVEADEQQWQLKTLKDVHQGGIWHPALAGLLEAYQPRPKPYFDLRACVLRGVARAWGLAFEQIGQDFCLSQQG